MSNHCTAILLAGGLGTRLGGDTPKQFLLLGGVPLAHYSFRTLVLHPLIDEVVVVVDEARRAPFERCFEDIGLSYKRLFFAEPGKRRQDSLKNGFQVVSSKPSFILVQDSARPFVSSIMIDEVLNGAKVAKAAAPAIPITSTIKEASKEKFVQKTLDRSHLYEVQTPQVVVYSALEEGFEFLKKTDTTVTDELSLVEKIGIKPLLTEGSRWNLKVTTREDFLLAEWILGAKLA